MEAGSLTFQLIDEDGEDLPGSWSYEWTGRDPLELAIYAITELSGKPWKWSSRREGRAALSQQRCRQLSIRVGKILRKENRAMASNVISRIIAQETLRPGRPPPDAREIAQVLSGVGTADWDAGPAQSAPAMVRAFRAVLKTASENEAGLRITWG